MVLIRSFAVSVVLSAALTGICTTVLHAQASPSLEGALIQSPQKPAVYFVQGGKLHYVPDPPTLESRWSWSQVRVVSQEDVDAIPVGDPIPSIGNRHIRWFYMGQPSTSNQRDWFEQRNGNWVEEYVNGASSTFSLIALGVPLPVVNGSNQRVIANGRVLEKSDHSMIVFIPDQISTDMWLQFKAPGSFDGQWSYLAQIQSVDGTIAAVNAPAPAQPALAIAQQPPASAPPRTFTFTSRFAQGIANTQGAARMMQENQSTNNMLQMWGLGSCLKRDGAPVGAQGYTVVSVDPSGDIITTYENGSWWAYQTYTITCQYSPP